MTFIDFGNPDEGASSPFGNLTSNAIGNQSAGGGAAPDAGLASNSIFGEGGLFGKGGGASLAIGGLQTLGSLFNSLQQQKLAKKTLKFQTNAFKTNLRNSTKVFNTALEDRIRTRFATEGRPEEADAKIERDRL